MDPKTEENDENDLKQPVIVTKYQAAGEVANQALLALEEKIQPGMTCFEICKLGDEIVAEKTSKIYSKQKSIKKGIAFPTTCNPTGFGGHFRPLEGDAEAQIAVKEGELVRLELGVHVDGYISQAGKTIVVGGAEKATQEQKDLLCAANQALELSLRMIKSGGNSADFTSNLKKLGNDLEFGLTENMMSQQVLRNIIDGPKQIHQNPGDQKVETVDFLEGNLSILILKGKSTLYLYS